MNKLEEYFKNYISKNNINNAFLIGNTNFDAIKDELENILSNFIFCSKINIENEPDITILTPESSIISKAEVLNLKEEILNTSSIHNKRVYIIKDAEKMNSQAGNSLLKILEEAPNNIYAILISNNINMVMDTIKSRCHVIFISSQSQNTYVTNITIEDMEVAKKFIKLIETKKEKTITNYNEFLSKDREEILKLFTILLYIYHDAINIIDNRLKYFDDIELSEYINSKNDLPEILRKIKVINDILQKINYNLNINLLFDRFIIEFGGSIDVKNS